MLRHVRQPKTHYRPVRLDALASILCGDTALCLQAKDHPTPEVNASSHFVVKSEVLSQSPSDAKVVTDQQRSCPTGKTAEALGLIPQHSATCMHRSLHMAFEF